MYHNVTSSGQISMFNTVLESDGSMLSSAVLNIEIGKVLRMLGLHYTQNQSSAQNLHTIL